MGFAFNVFVSSSCYELRDMRARLQEWLSGMGFNPILSEGEGFPHADGMPPYASCLKTMDECTMVIGVIERQYGTPFDDWGPFPQYKGLAPTHAELRHALNTGKRVLIYVQDGTWNFYGVAAQPRCVRERRSPRPGRANTRNASRVENANLGAQLRLSRNCQRRLHKRRKGLP
jgi:Domain of unknown function (DUF4062)